MKSSRNGRNRLSARRSLNRVALPRLYLLLVKSSGTGKPHVLWPILGKLDSSLPAPGILIKPRTCHGYGSRHVPPLFVISALSTTILARSIIDTGHIIWRNCGIMDLLSVANAKISSCQLRRSVTCIIWRLRALPWRIEWPCTDMNAYPNYPEEANRSL